MAAYLIGQVIVIGENQFAPYLQTTSTLIAQHGGQVLDAVRAVEIIEGDWPVGALTALGREGLLCARCRVMRQPACDCLTFEKNVLSPTLCRFTAERVSQCGSCPISSPARQS
jgi:hypothetical protein